MRVCFLVGSFNLYHSVRGSWPQLRLQSADDWRQRIEIMTGKPAARPPVAEATLSPFRNLMRRCLMQLCSISRASWGGDSEEWVAGASGGDVAPLVPLLIRRGTHCRPNSETARTSRAAQRPVAGCPAACPRPLKVRNSIFCT
jgi:hypothetical protein